MAPPIGSAWSPPAPADLLFSNAALHWLGDHALLLPRLAALDEPERGPFLPAHSARIAAAYPKQPDGRTLLPFRRVFVVARL